MVHLDMLICQCASVTHKFNKTVIIQSVITTLFNSIFNDTKVEFQVAYEIPLYLSKATIMRILLLFSLQYNRNSFLPCQTSVLLLHPQSLVLVGKILILFFCGRKLNFGLINCLIPNHNIGRMRVSSSHLLLW